MSTAVVEPGNTVRCVLLFLEHTDVTVMMDNKCKFPDMPVRPLSQTSCAHALSWDSFTVQYSLHALQAEAYLGCMVTDDDVPEVRPEVEMEEALTASAADTNSYDLRSFQVGEGAALRTVQMTIIEIEVAKLCLALETVGEPSGGCCCSKTRRVSTGPSASVTPVAALLRQAQKGVFWAFDLLARHPRLCL